MRPSDHLADQHRAAIPDLRTRNLFFQDSMATQHTTLAVSNTITKTVDEFMRIRSVRVGTVTGGTVTIQVQVDGRDLFDDTLRPVSGGAVREPTNVYTFPAGSAVSTIIEATSGVPSGNANVVIEIEPYRLAPQLPTVAPSGGDRLPPSRRERADLLNATGATVRSTVSERRERGIGRLLDTHKAYQRYTAPQIGEPPPEDFVTPRPPRRR